MFTINRLTKVFKTSKRFAYSFDNINNNKTNQRFYVNRKNFTLAERSQNHAILVTHKKPVTKAVTPKLHEILD